MSDVPKMIAKEVAGGALGLIGSKALEGFLAVEPVDVVGLLGGLETRLETIERRLLYLTRLVRELPALIAETVNRSNLDQAWAHVEASFGELRDRGGPAVLTDEAARLDLRGYWNYIVEYENRPARLLKIPLWTEFLRARLDVSHGADTDVWARISEKCQEMEDFIADETLSASRRASKLQKLFTKRYEGKGKDDKANGIVFLKKGRLTTRPPFASWKMHGDIKVRKRRPGPFGGYKRKPHRRFRRHRNEVNKQAKTIKRAMTKNLTAVQALTPALLVLQQYRDWLAGA